MARINREALVEQIMLHDVFEQATKSQITDFVNFFFDNIQEQVAAGNEVAIPGFGKFQKYQRTNGEYKPKFSAFAEFKQQVSA